MIKFIREWWQDTGLIAIGSPKNLVDLRCTASNVDGDDVFLYGRYLLNIDFDDRELISKIMYFNSDFTPLKPLQIRRILWKHKLEPSDYKEREFIGGYMWDAGEIYAQSPDQGEYLCIESK